MASGNDSHRPEGRAGEPHESVGGGESRERSRRSRRPIVIGGLVILGAVYLTFIVFALEVVSNYGEGMNWVVIATSMAAMFVVVLSTWVLSQRLFLKASNDVHVTGRRVLATIADGLVLLTLAYVMSPSLEMTSWVGMVYFLLVVLYYILLEGYLGQTLGKMLLGIKVIREDNGEAPGLRAATIRTLLRAIDSLLFYLVAFIAVLVTAKRQRLGDVVAHTLVVARKGNRRQSVKGPIT